MARPKLDGYIQKQVRIPKEINEYIVHESERLELPQSTVLVMLLNNGRNLNEAVKKNPLKFFET